MTRRARIALVVLLCLSYVLTGASYFLQARQSSESQAAQHREQVAQQQAGQQLGNKLCTTFGRLAALQPPAGPASVNPARGYEQQLHATLDELGVDLGCKG